MPDILLAGLCGVQKCSTAGEIQEQLKALEGQYRDDMDALHKAYATRRKELEDALQYC